jgi:hypothetical protein
VWPRSRPGIALGELELDRRWCPVKKQQLKPHVRKHIDHAVDSLAEEFDEVASPQEVRKISEEQLGEILPAARFDDFVPSLVSANTRAELLEQQTRASDRNEEGESDQPGDTAAPGRTGADTEWEPSPEERRQHPARSENEPKKR